MGLGSMLCPVSSLGTLLDSESFRVAITLRVGADISIPHSGRCGGGWTIDVCIGTSRIIVVLYLQRRFKHLDVCSLASHDYLTNRTMLVRYSYNGHTFLNNLFWMPFLHALTKNTRYFMRFFPGIFPTTSQIEILTE